MAYPVTLPSAPSTLTGYALNFLTAPPISRIPFASGLASSSAFRNTGWDSDNTDDRKLRKMTLEYKRHRDFPLRLPLSIFARASEIAHQEGFSLNHLIGLAVAEKISRLDQGEILSSNKQLSRLVSSVSRPKSAESTGPQAKPLISEAGTTGTTPTRRRAKRITD